MHYLHYLFYKDDRGVKDNEKKAHYHLNKSNELKNVVESKTIKSSSNKLDKNNKDNLTFADHILYTIVSITIFGVLIYTMIHI